ncbi:MAG: peptidylprolyl isomerase [Pseudomonadota bacterium]
MTHANRRMRRPHKTAALAAALALGLHTVMSASGLHLITGNVQAQTVFTEILVNDFPITNFDINSRSGLLRLQGLSSAEARSRAEDELIDETLQRAEGRRLGLSVSQDEVEEALRTIAGRSNLSVSQLGQALGQRGVDISTLRDSVEAQILWSQIVGARFRATVQVDEQDVLAALDSQTTDDDAAALTATEYSIREIIFIVPEGSPASAFQRRESEANALRARFETCAQGIASARQLTSVVVQDEIRRFSSDLSEPLNDMLSDTPTGRLTPPERTDNGISVLAVCNKREIRSDADARRDVENELRNEEGVLLSRGYLRDLRASATIIRPN